MRKTTTLAMLSTALLALAPAAKSQDVNRADKTDVYLGVLSGFASGTSTVFDVVGGSYDQHLNPVELGVVGGFRLNHNDWLLGAEADINANLSNTFPYGGSLSIYENDGNGHLRGLVGRQMGPVSLFLTGGLAGSHIKYNNGFGGVDDKIMLGWTAGIGGEYAATENLALRLEAIHDETSSGFSDGYNGKWVENTVRVGAIFKF
jgi:opacity protein-like surface antigen